MNEVSGGDKWNLDTLLDILKTEAEAREKCMITSLKQYSQGVINKKPYRNTLITANASALFASNKNSVKLVPFVVNDTLQHSVTSLLISEKERIFSGDKVVAIFV